MGSTRKRQILKSKNDWTATVAILGARRHYAVPSILASEKRLERFFTDFYLRDSSFEGLLRKKLLKSSYKLFRQAAMRSSLDLQSGSIHSFPLLGIAYAFARRLSTRASHAEKVDIFFNKLFTKSVNSKGFGNASIVYGMNTASLEMFSYAKEKKLSCILEQCSSPYPIYDRLLAEEYQLWPRWERDQYPHSHQLLYDRERGEWDLADTIVCGSEFVASGLEMSGVSRQKCVVIPSPVDVQKFTKVERKNTSSNSPLNVLFLGGIRLMKGIQYLSEALHRMGQNRKIHVKAAGAILLEPEAINSLEKNMDILGLIPRAETAKLFSWADVLVLPSICEGSALVTYEALASGVPVITTPNAGSHVIDGFTGFIVPIRDSLAIAEKLDLYARDANLLKDMSSAARHYAEEHFSYQEYSKNIISVAENISQIVYE